jgi:transposase-like protein
MLTCPDCGATNVDVTAPHRSAGEQRWHGHCLACEGSWDFDDA